MEATFDFSVVTAVYNAELYLGAAVESLEKQTFGFERVQLILIDDGSTDGSVKLCDDFAAQHPENVKVVHTEHRGVSAARNEGLKYVRGKYVSFLDADDKLSLNALEEVFPFFEAHPETDVVSVKMWYFDGHRGSDALNYKYGDGSRVIDLEAEPFNPQLAVTSAFVRAEALQGKTFDTQLSYAEDAKLLQSVLIEKRTLGVVSTAHHWYRRRSKDEAAAVWKNDGDETWYLPYLNRFCKETFDRCEERFGTIPRFIQYAVAYDLQWRIRQRRIPYANEIFSLIARIDDDIIEKLIALQPYKKAALRGETDSLPEQQDGATQTDGAEPAFAFTVITAVYNAEPFLPETVESLEKQTFGFENVQLILIDDGSTDGSPEMCDKYAAQYPDNVVVVHKENGGVSSARNEGLKRVRGKYVSFLDADDKLSVNTLAEVYPFFEKHPETDVVSIKMWFFDGQRGSHMLNYKYDEGSRVIDLEAEPFNPQLAVTSAFVRAEALKGKFFDTRLSYAEDAKLLQSVLIEKLTLGVVSTAHHWYRRRSTGEASAIQKSGTNIAWYLPYLTYFCEETFSMCEERFGAIPRFIQYTVAYDLQWRIRQRKIPSTVLNEMQKELYRSMVFSLLSRIDDDIIAKQIALQPFQKAFLLYGKHGEVPELYVNDKGTHMYRYGDEEPFEIGYPRLSCDFFTVEDSTITIECATLMLNGFDGGYPDIYCVANDVEYTCEPFERKQYQYSMDLKIASRIGYVFRIPLPDLNTPLRIRFYRRTAVGPVFMDKLMLTQFFPMSGKYKNSYAVIGKRVLTYSEGELTFEKLGASRFRREVRFLKELYKRGKPEERHAVVGRLAYAVLKPFCFRRIWLISDRNQVAGDNGEALFRYLCAEKPKNVKLYFAVSDKCPAYQELKKIGHVVKAQSYWHKIIFLLSEFNISSQADDDIITQFSHYDQPYRDIQYRIPFVFLQHGVIKDDLSDWLKRYNRNLAGFVTSAKAEYDSIRDYPYFYPDRNIWLTGLPRFDRLYHNEKHCITIMPTWRHMWVSHTNKKTGVRELKAGFEEGEFYQFFNSLLNDRRLLDAAKQYGYEIRFLPHTLMQPHMHRFTQNDEVTFLSSDVTYRDVFAESDLILTDYSSVVFDFAYLRKPVVYTQFDRESFYSGEHMYVPGYFDYDRDAFGEVETEYEKTVDRLIEYMQNGCQLKEKYRERIDSFFAFSDQENCRRVYEKIRELQRFEAEKRKQ